MVEEGRNCCRVSRVAVVKVVECSLWAGTKGKVVEIEEGANDTHWQDQESLSDGFPLMCKATIALKLQPVE